MHAHTYTHYKPTHTDTRTHTFDWYSSYVFLLQYIAIMGALEDGLLAKPEIQCYIDIVSVSLTYYTQFMETNISLRTRYFL